jgi:NAD-dependent deacetylase
MKTIVVLSGAGISAESGIATFRDAGGLWEGHDIMEVASPQGWRKNPELVLDFYNKRRKNALEALPNAGHLALKHLEKTYRVQIITQNVDDLHEKAGSSHILHLHGKLNESRSSLDPNLVYPIQGFELNLGEKCAKGSQLRPNIVWFGEAVPAIEEAVPLVMQADILIVVGTSLQVYPAAGLLEYATSECEVIIVDPNLESISGRREYRFIKDTAAKALPRLAEELLQH